MRFVRRTIGMIVAAAACGGDGGIVDPNDEEAIPGLSLTASVALLDVTEATGSRIFMVSVEVVVRNNTNETIEHHYPAGCPVRMRLYDRFTDALLYDQAALTCNVATIVPFTLAPQESRTLTSGTRFPWEVGGDSIPPNTYRATGVLRITGENPLELEAGTYRVPTCNLTAVIPSCD